MVAAAASIMRAVGLLQRERDRLPRHPRRSTSSGWGHSELRCVAVLQGDVLFVGAGAGGDAAVLSGGVVVAGCSLLRLLFLLVFVLVSPSDRTTRLAFTATNLILTGQPKQPVAFACKKQPAHVERKRLTSGRKIGRLVSWCAWYFLVKRFSVQLRVDIGMFTVLLMRDCQYDRSNSKATWNQQIP